MNNETSVFDIKNLARRVRNSKNSIANSTIKSRNSILEDLASTIERNEKIILAANKLDIKGAKNISPALLDRLTLDSSRLMQMSIGVREVAKLPDPLGQWTDLSYRPSGIQVGKMRVPLGVVAVIYESRPNVTADVGSLALKSGNAVLLKGGSESLHTNAAILDCIHEALRRNDLDEDCVHLVKSSDRAVVKELLQLDQFIDVLVPRGGKSLVEAVINNAKMPVIKHLDGVCHVYVDESADLDMAVKISLNSKIDRVGVCNAMETLLVSESIASVFAPTIIEEFLVHGVELRGCDLVRKLNNRIMPASDEDWSSEYLAPILSMKIVPDIDAAITHINRYGSGHTDVIVSKDYQRIRKFLREVDSSSVMANASTRFADGYEYGLGAEVGISTDKIHARGPVGLEGLTSQKWVVLGEGQIRNG